MPFFKVIYDETVTTRMEGLIEAETESAARQCWIDGDYVLGPDEVGDPDFDTRRESFVVSLAETAPPHRGEWARIAFDSHGVTEGLATEGTDQIDLDERLFGDDPLPRYLLIQSNIRNAGRYVTPVDTVEAAVAVIEGDEYAEEWETLALVDLDTGIHLSQTTKVTFE